MYLELSFTTKHKTYQMRTTYYTTYLQETCVSFVPLFCGLWGYCQIIQWDFELSWYKPMMAFLDDLNKSYVYHSTLALHHLLVEFLYSVLNISSPDYYW